MRDLLAQGWQWTQEHWEEIIRDEAERTGLKFSVVKAYLQKHIQYELTEREHEGLEYFGKMLEGIDCG